MRPVDSALARMIPEDDNPVGQERSLSRASRRRIAFAGLSVILFFGVCELGLRLTGWLLLLHASHQPARAEEGAFRVICLGDSFTWGVGANAGTESYPRVLESLLNSTTPGRFRVVNVGVPGLSASGILRRMQDYVKRDVDLFIILAGMNVNERDLIELRQSGGARGSYRLLGVKHVLSHLRTYKLLRNGVNYIRRRLFPQTSVNAPDDAMTLYNFQDYQRICQRDLSRICELVQGQRLNAVLLNYPQKVPPKNPYTKIEYYHLYWRGNLPHAYWSGKKRPPPQRIRDADYLVKTLPGETALNAIIRIVTQRYGIPLIDVRKAFEDRGNGNELYSADEHPNAAGYRLMAQTVYGQLLKRKLIPVSVSTSEKTRGDP